MIGRHALVGAAVPALFFLATICDAIGIGGRAIRAGKYVAYRAALFLVVQYLFGIGLLSSGFRNRWYHYLPALLVLPPLGLEHGYIRRRFGGRDQAVALTPVSAVTTILVFVAYLIGRNSM